jgi:hypothetical protein
LTIFRFVKPPPLGAAFYSPSSVTYQLNDAKKQQDQESSSKDYHFEQVEEVVDPIHVALHFLKIRNESKNNVTLDSTAVKRARCPKLHDDKL